MTDLRGSGTVVRRTKIDMAPGPEFVRLFGPVLDALRDLGGSGRPREVTDWIASKLEISDNKLNETIKDGSSRFRNQIYWARFYLAKSGHIDSLGRGIWALSDLGNRTRLTYSDALIIFHKVRDQFGSSKIEKDIEGDDPPEGETVDERTIDEEARFKSEITQTLRALPADGFERFCRLALRAVGFEEVSVTGRSGDGGIDGIGTLRVNRLITDRVVFQCKRYATQISPSYIRDFRGAMQGRADRGIFISTTNFSAEAIREAAREGASRIELVDLDKMIELMMDLELGVTKRTINVVDRSFFEKFEKGSH